MCVCARVMCVFVCMCVHVHDKLYVLAGVHEPPKELQTGIDMS